MADYSRLISDTEGRLGIRPGLLHAIITKGERSGASAVSPKGAGGLAQLMPGTAAEMGVRDRFDPAQSIDGGGRYLKKMLDAFEGDETKAVAAYNAGPGAVRKYGGVPPYKETQAYVQRVIGGGGGKAAMPTPDDLMSYFGQGPTSKAPAPKLAASAAVSGGAPSPDELMSYFGQKPAAAASKGVGPTFQPVNDFMAPVVAAKDNLLKHQADDKAAMLAQKPTLNPLKLASGLVDTVGRTGRTLGDLLALPGAVVTGAVDAAVAKPAARALSKLPITPYAAPTLSIVNGKPQLSAPRALKGQEAVDTVAGDISLALSSGRAIPGAAKAVAVPKLPKLTKSDAKISQVLAKAIERDQMKPADVLATLDPKVPAYHAGGENLASVAEIAAQSPGAARQILRQAVRDSHAQAADAVKADIASNMGGRGDYFATHDAMQAERSAKAKPLFEAAYAEPIDADVFQSQIAPLLSRLPKGTLDLAYDLARRAGKNPEELGLANLDTFTGLSAAKPPPPEVIAAKDLSDLRRGIDPKAGQGPSLLQFLSKNGGLNDYGGELANMDAQMWHKVRPFMRKLISETGLAPEDAAQRAFDAGYFPERVAGRMDDASNMHPVSPDDLYAAINEELRGKARFAREPDDAAAQRRQRLDSLEERANIAGIDPTRATPKEMAQGLAQHDDDLARLEAFADGEAPAMSPNEPTPVVNPTLETLHFVKKAMDQNLEQYRNPVTRELDLTGSPGAQVDSQVRSDLAQTMRKLNKNYDEAMTTWGDDSERVNALELGRNVFSGKFDMQAERLKGLVGDMSDAARDDFRKGVGEALLSSVRTKGGVTAMRQILKNEEFGDRVALAFPDDKSFASFMDAAAKRVEQQDRNNRVFGGSQTYGRQAARADVESQGVNGLDIAGEALDAGFNPIRIAGKAGKAALKALPRKNTSVIGDPVINEALGRTMADPEEMTRLLNLLQAIKARQSRPLLAGVGRATLPLLPSSEATKRQLPEPIY